MSASIILKSNDRAGHRSFKWQNEEKEIIIKSRVRKLYAEYLTKFEYCVMDDETYYVSELNQIPGQEFSMWSLAKNIVRNHTYIIIR